MGKIYQYPKVREIWPTPIGGFVASTTASSTFVRFVDRGTGYIYDMNMASATPANISNTTVPLVYESYWNSNGMSGIFRYIKEGSDDITNFYVQLRSTATTTKTVDRFKYRNNKYSANYFGADLVSNALCATRNIFPGKYNFNGCITER